MKRLFEVRGRLGSAGHKCRGAYFESKQEAKQLRDQLNVELPGNNYHVTKGPDHRLYKGGAK